MRQPKGVCDDVSFELSRGGKATYGGPAREEAEMVDSDMIRSDSEGTTFDADLKNRGEGVRSSSDPWLASSSREKDALSVLETEVVLADILNDEDDARNVCCVCKHKWYQKNDGNNA